MKSKKKKSRALPRKHRILILFRDRSLPLFFSTLLLFSCLVACRPPVAINALSVAKAMLTLEEDRPAGDLYALPGSSSLDEALADGTQLRIADAELLYAALGTEENYFSNQELWQLDPSRVDDGVLRLASTYSPHEWMVFHCISRTDTDALSELLLQRLNILRRQYETVPDAPAGGVYIVGNYVMLLFSHRAEEALHLAKKMIY